MSGFEMGNQMDALESSDAEGQGNEGATVSKACGMLSTVHRSERQHEGAFRCADRAAKVIDDWSVTQSEAAKRLKIARAGFE